MDSMFKPEQYGGVYLGAFFYIFSLTLPHSIAANLAFPHKASPGHIHAFSSGISAQASGGYAEAFQNYCAWILSMSSGPVRPCMWGVAFCSACMSRHQKMRFAKKRAIQLACLVAGPTERQCVWCNARQPCQEPVNLPHAHPPGESHLHVDVINSHSIDAYWLYLTKCRSASWKVPRLVWVGQLWACTHAQAVLCLLADLCLCVLLSPAVLYHGEGTARPPQAILHPSTLPIPCG